MKGRTTYIMYQPSQNIWQQDKTQQKIKLKNYETLPLTPQPKLYHKSTNPQPSHPQSCCNNTMIMISLA